MKKDYEAILEQHQVIETKRLVLRRFSANDAEDVFAYAKDCATVKYLTWPAHESEEQSRFAIENFYQGLGTFAIAIKETNQCIGCFELRLDATNDKSGFGYVLNRDYWGQGYMTEVLSTMMDFCFNIIEVNRIESTYYVGNEGSGHVMRKCGMTQEGLALQEVKIKGQFFDVVHLAKLNPKQKN